MSVLSDSIVSTLHDFFDAMSTSIVFRKMTNTGGANPAINPVTGAITVQTTATAGASTITLTAPAGNWVLLVGDKFTVAGNATVYTITNQVTAASGKFTGVTFTPVLAANATAGAAVTMTWKNDYTVQAVIFPYDDKLINGTTITIKDHRVYARALDVNGASYPDPTNLDRLVIDGNARAIGITAEVKSGEVTTLWDIQAKG